MAEDSFPELRDPGLRALALRIRAVEHWQPRREWLEESKIRLLRAFDGRMPSSPPTSAF